MNTKKYDVIIVGSGPSGLGAADFLVKNTSDLKILIVDKGRDAIKRTCPMNVTKVCVNCKPCNIMCGVGGAGGMSDGKLNLTPYVGGDLTEYDLSETEAFDLINKIDREIWDKFDIDKDRSSKYISKSDVDNLVQKAYQVGVNYMPIIQKHIGSDKLPFLINAWKNFLISKGVEFKLNTIVDDINIDIVDGKKKVSGIVVGQSKIYSNTVVLCVGREGQGWALELAKKYDVNFLYKHIDVGVRVETKYEIFKPLTDVNYDPKIYINTDEYNDNVRTFCTNPKGWVAKENYDEYVGVNGHSEKDRLSSNTNFALLVSVKLTEPMENSFKYGRSIANIAQTLGGGNVLLQTLGDLKRYRRSTYSRIKKSVVEPTLSSFVPGDLSMLFPGRIIKNLLSALKKLDKLAPGINGDSTLLYGPEIKYYSVKLDVDKNFMTNIEGLFAAGDGAGLSRDIINANCTGYLCAKGICKFRGF